MKPTLLISCHADTGFRAHQLSVDKNGNCFGGDYNEGMVSARLKSVKAATQALTRIAKAFQST